MTAIAQIYKITGVCIITRSVTPPPRPLKSFFPNPGAARTPNDDMDKVRSRLVYFKVNCLF